MSSPFDDDFTNADAARTTLAALTITDETVALATLVLSLAEACDDEPTNASLAKQYREALTDLMGSTRDDNTDDLARLYREIRNTSQPEPAH